MLYRLFVILLVASLSIPAQAGARKIRFYQAITSSTRLVAPTTAAAAKAAEKMSDKVTHTGQTLLFILALGIVEAARQKYSGENSQIQLRAAMVPELAAAILNDGRIWSGLAGAGVAGGIANYLKQNLKNPAIRSGLGKFLLYAAETSVVLVGWEFGSQLWEEAAQQLANDQEYILSQQIGSLLKAFVVRADTQADLQKRRVANKMIQNMFKTLVSSSELRATWIDNTLRTRIATGHFATLVAGLVGGATVGSAIFPGIGSVIGMFVGAAGTLFIPEEEKHKITKGFRKVRRYIANHNRAAYRKAFHGRQAEKAKRLYQGSRQALVVTFYEDLSEAKSAQEQLAILRKIQAVYDADKALFPNSSAIGKLQEFYLTFVHEFQYGSANELRNMKFFISNQATRGYSEAKILQHL